jgi:hypothetical protein
MSARVRVDHGDDGLVALKCALDDGQAVDLVKELAVLTVCRRPGVVEARGLRPEAEGPALATTWVGTRSLADLAAIPPAQAASIGARVAEITADLHDLGAVHGQLHDPSHVLLDPSGAPVLCGFGQAALVEQSGERARRARADDVAGLGELLAVLAGGEALFDFPRSRRIARRRAPVDDLRKALLNLADHARADDPTCRPTARALSASLSALSPGVARSSPSKVDHTRCSPETSPPSADDPFAQLRRSASGPDTSRRLPSGRRLLGLLAVAAGLGAIGLLAVNVFGADHRTGGVDAQATPASRSTTAPPTTAGRPPGSAPTTTATTTTTTAVAPPPASSVAHVVEIDGRRYQIGEAGDEILVDDLACDGGRRAAVLRPSTGAVFVFDTWAEPGVDLVAQPFAELEPGARLELDRSDGSCPRLIARLPDGTELALPPVTA